MLATNCKPKPYSAGSDRCGRGKLGRKASVAASSYGRVRRGYETLSNTEVAEPLRAQVVIEESATRPPVLALRRGRGEMIETENNVKFGVCKHPDSYQKPLICRFPDCGSDDGEGRPHYHLCCVLCVIERLEREVAALKQERATCANPGDPTAFLICRRCSGFGTIEDDGRIRNCPVCDGDPKLRYEDFVEYVRQIDAAQAKLASQLLELELLRPREWLCPDCGYTYSGHKELVLCPNDGSICHVLAKTVEKDHPGQRILDELAAVRDELSLHKRIRKDYMDRMEQALGPIRRRRDTGEPARSDAQEVAELCKRLEAADEMSDWIEVLLDDCKHSEGGVSTCPATLQELEAHRKAYQDAKEGGK